MDALRGICIVILVLAVTGQVSSQAATEPPEISGDYFNCRRNGQQDLCSALSPNSNCSSTNSTTCDCVDTNLRGIHCVPAAIAVDPCTIKNCSGRGDCFLNSTGNNEEICYCDQKYTGDNCELPRAEVKCNGTFMMVTVRPHGNFQGVIFAREFRDEVACVLTETATNEYSATFSLDPSNDTNCGVQSFNRSGSVEYEARLRILYNSNPDIFFIHDQILTGTCVLDGERNITSAAFVVNAGDDQLENATGRVSAFPVRLEVEDSDQSTFLNEGDTTLVGTPLKVAIILERNQAFDNFKAFSCFASNMPPSLSGQDNYERLFIVDEQGCPETHPVVGEDPSFEDSPSADVRGMAKFPVSAFVFAKGSNDADGENSIYFTCTVTLCQTGNDACDHEDCGNSVLSYGRRKREAADDSVILSRSIQVRFGDAKVEEDIRQKESTEINTEECLGDPRLQTIVSVLGIGFLALLLALIVLAVLLCRRRRRDEDKKKMEDEDHSMASSTQTLHMHIPRPRV